MPVTNGDAILKSLNKAQCCAVSSEAPTVAILAGPGSGKTHTLTSRVVWLVDNVGYKPCDIVVATFTVKAAREMKERIGKALGDGREKGIILGTFHSIARRYLAAYGQRIGLDQKFGIADDSDSKGIIRRICKRLDVTIDLPIVRAWISKKKAKGNVDNGATEAKSGKPSVGSQALEMCFVEYQKHLKVSNLLDYDDLLVRCVELLRLHPSCVSNIQTVLIDEYQDTNGVQYELMKLFAQQRRRITIVGDPDQSIYGWRSAEIRNLRRFLRDFPDTEEISLEENFRSSSSILDVSLKVIQQDETRYQKALVPVHNKGTRPVLRKLKNPMGEADWIVSEIKRARMMSGGMIDLNDIAVLLRSSSLSRHIESALGRDGMPYKMVGGFKFYDRDEIKVVLDYLRIIHQPHSNDALARIINKPKRGVGEPTVKALLEEAEKDTISLWTLLDRHCRGDRAAKTMIRKQTEQKISGELIKLIKRLRTRYYEATEGNPFDLVELIEHLLRDLRLEKYLEDAHASDYESRWANVQEFVKLAAEFMKDKTLVEEEVLPEIENLQQVQETDMLARFLANVSLASDKQNHNEEEEGKPVITLSTIHAAKGLEWPIVFIPAVYKGSIPHMRSDDEPEERRLLYVAMTRAQALLYLSTPVYSSNSEGGGLELSPFIGGLASTHFLRKGPSFERPTMTEISGILRRELLPECAIYEKLAPMFAVEDNLFPVDPSDPKASSSMSTGHYGENNRVKRQKIYHTSSARQTAPETVEGWNAPYATTMGSSSSFTLPGFTTAGAQHATNVAENVAKAPSRKTPAGMGKPMQNRPSAQRSLLSYGVKVHDQSSLAQDSAVPAPSMQRSFSSTRQTWQRPSQPWLRQRPEPLHRPNQQTPAIEPELLNHKLGSSKLVNKPQREEDVSSKAYVCFSSSPNKPSPEKPAAPVVQEEEKLPIDEAVRPTSCYHATTVNLPAGLRGFKKPSSLGREGIAPLDRLRKPFKPVTMNRRQ